MINEIESKKYLKQKRIAVLQAKPNLSTLDKIANAVLRVTGINLVQMQSKIRQRQIVDARIIFIILATRKTKKTQSEIADYIKKNRTTIPHHILHNSEIPEIKSIINKIL